VSAAQHKAINIMKRPLKVRIEKPYLTFLFLQLLLKGKQLNHILEITQEFYAIGRTILPLNYKECQP
jgi:hypothetical protein